MKRIALLAFVLFGFVVEPGFGQLEQRVFGRAVLTATNTTSLPIEISLAGYDALRVGSRDSSNLRLARFIFPFDAQGQYREITGSVKICGRFEEVTLKIFPPPWAADEAVVGRGKAGEEIALTAAYLATDPDTKDVKRRVEKIKTNLKRKSRWKMREAELKEWLRRFEAFGLEISGSQCIPEAIIPIKMVVYTDFYRRQAITLAVREESYSDGKRYYRLEGPQYAY
ncbi:hypothetical protein C4571_00760 [Candidatus Parcubacteria bacterium]|nr:MAG: hypothetical protein C4571_00760 [Candidatus Parcubacteria bacterium]